jgi:transcriptional regulator with XRE-family HTH domain
MNTTTMTTLEPKLLGFWTRCIRQSLHWSQEALAASSSLDVRTIQRIEAGQSVSITTRRLLSRGLGYENPDTFDDPEVTTKIHDLIHKLLKIVQTSKKEELEKQFPDHIPVPCSLVTSGETLGRLADISNGVLLNANDGISHKAKQVAASLFDYIRDLQDVGDGASFSDKVAFNRDLEGLLRNLEYLGTSVYSATRSIKILGSNWVDKTPMPFTAGYVTVVPAEMLLQEMIVPRRLS